MGATKRLSTGYGEDIKFLCCLRDLCDCWLFNGVGIDFNSSHTRYGIVVGILSACGHRACKREFLKREIQSAIALFLPETYLRETENWNCAARRYSSLTRHIMPLAGVEPACHISVIGLLSV